MGSATTGHRRRCPSSPGFASRGRARSLKSTRARRGQSLIEYILMTAMLATLSVAFAKFYGQKVFGNGLRELPVKVGACITHPNPQGGSSGSCR